MPSQLLFVVLNYHQKRTGVRGNLVEIGCWEGKTLLLFAHLAGSGERSIGYDIEIRPGLITRSQAFRPADRIVLHEVDSKNLTSTEILKDGGPRIFHVDGGHMQADATRDLRLAFAVTNRRGVVVLDDFFAPTLPGVTAALFESFERRWNGEFVPFALCGAKCWMVERSMVETYKAACLSLMPIPPQVNPSEFQDFLGGRPLIYHFHGLW